MALARFASEASNAFDSPKTPEPLLSEHLRSLYAALTDNFHYAILAMDESTFVTYGTSSSPDDRPNDKAVERLFGFLDMESLFSMRLASPVVDATDERLPRGPVFGKCYPFCREGDVVVALHGRSTLLALRADLVDEGRFKVLGEVCVPKYMEGQAVGLFEERDFELT